MSFNLPLRLLGALVLAIFTFASSAQAQIVAFGSSSTYGQGVGRDETYPAKLERALRAKGFDVSVTNAGVSGDTTVGELSRLDSSIPSGTKVALVEMGVNDATSGISIATTRANVNTALAKLKARGVQVLVLDVRNLGLAPVARANGADYMLFGAFPGNGEPKYRVANDPQQATRGYGHFNSAGYDVIVGQMLPHVVALLRKAK